MPQDTTIYWDGTGQLPALIDSLPIEQQKIVLNEIHKITDEQNHLNPTHAYSYLGVVILVFSLLAIYSNKITKRKEIESQSIINEEQKFYNNGDTNYPVLTYSGNKLNFFDKDLTIILTKHFPYFNGLDGVEKTSFIDRLQQFLSIKTFIIHDESGFKEMPVLISATAIQLTLGLDKYLLPNFDVIHIFPEAFIGVQPSIRFLEGNVSGNTINLSWKHFLKGFQFPNDGANVGLHEMAHAYYFQYFETNQQIDKDFVGAFPGFKNFGNKVFEQENKDGTNLYSRYALQDFQEFWAESIEIFFEKPSSMKDKYPQLYQSICAILNQDPLGVKSI